MPNPQMPAEAQDWRKDHNKVMEFRIEVLSICSNSFIVDIDYGIQVIHSESNDARRR